MARDWARGRVAKEITDYYPMPTPVHQIMVKLLKAERARARRVVVQVIKRYGGSQNSITDILDEVLRRLS